MTSVGIYVRPTILHFVRIRYKYHEWHNKISRSFLSRFSDVFFQFAEEWPRLLTICFDVQMFSTLFVLSGSVTNTTNRIKDVTFVFSRFRFFLFLFAKEWMSLTACNYVLTSFDAPRHSRRKRLERSCEKPLSTSAYRRHFGKKTRRPGHKTSKPGQTDQVTRLNVGSIGSVS